MHADQNNDRYFEHDGARLRYRDQGAGPALLLLHGWLLDLTLWDPLVPLLEEGFRVIRIDRRGFGASSGTPGLEADVEDALALLRHLGVQRVAALGMSQAARVALRMAERAEGSIACLVLDGAPPLEGLPDLGWEQETTVAEYRDLLRRHGIVALRQQLTSHPLLRLHSTERSARRLLAGMLERYSGSDLEAPPATSEPVAADRFTRLRLPVLILNGELDSPQRLRVGEALRDAVRGAERQVLPSAGHLACLDNPAAYAAAVTRFLSHHASKWGQAPGRRT